MYLFYGIFQSIWNSVKSPVSKNFTPAPPTFFKKYSVKSPHISINLKFREITRLQEIILQMDFIGFSFDTKISWNHFPLSTSSNFIEEPSLMTEYKEIGCENWKINLPKFKTPYPKEKNPVSILFSFATSRYQKHISKFNSKQSGLHFFCVKET